MIFHGSVSADETNFYNHLLATGAGWTRVSFKITSFGAVWNVFALVSHTIHTSPNFFFKLWYRLRHAFPQCKQLTQLFCVALFNEKCCCGWPNAERWFFGFYQCIFVVFQLSSCFQVASKHLMSYFSWSFFSYVR